MTTREVVALFLEISSYLLKLFLLFRSVIILTLYVRITKVSQTTSYQLFTTLDTITTYEISKKKTIEQCYAIEKDSRC